MNKHVMIPNLKSLRNRRGWNQEDTAKAAGISRSHYAMIELGKSRPGVEAAQRLGECLYFDWQDFFKAKKATHETFCLK